jgi:hypothetical protein
MKKKELLNQILSASSPIRIKGKVLEYLFSNPEDKDVVLYLQAKKMKSGNFKIIKIEN